jgi:hypothetical protein
VTKVLDFNTAADVAKAEAEGEFTFYSHDSEPAIAGILEAFSKDFPKIKGKYVRAQTGTLYSRTIAERSANKFTADVIQFSELTTAADFQKRGGYQNYISPEAEHYSPEHMSDPPGNYFWRVAPAAAETSVSYTRPERVTLGSEPKVAVASVVMPADATGWRIATGEVLRLTPASLRPGGIVFLYVPNYDSASRLLMGKDAHFIWPTHHLNYYTPATIRDLLRRHGLETAYIATEGLDIVDYLWYRREMHGADDAGVEPIADLLQFFINAGAYGKNLRAIGRKPR